MLRSSPTLSSAGLLGVSIVRAGPPSAPPASKRRKRAGNEEVTVETTSEFTSPTVTAAEVDQAADNATEPDVTTGGAAAREFTSHAILKKISFKYV